MAFQNLVKKVAGGIGKSIDVAGKMLGNRFPELNVSESLQSFGGAPGGYVYVPPSKQTSTGAAPMSTPSSSTLGIRTSAPSSGGGTYVPPTQPTYNAPQPDYGAEGDRTAEEQSRIRSGIEEAYAPIFQSLDERIGLVGPQREEFLSGVQSLVTPQQGLVESERVKGVKGLEAAKTEEEATAKSAIRDLESDVRNQMRAAGNYFGTLGAGDSSATGLASETIARSALQARGKVREGLIKAVGTIDAKISDVNSLASDQLLKIDQWKGNQIQSIKTFFLTRLDDLENSKANAQGSRASAIANMISNTEQEYVSRLRKLDDDVYNFKSAVSTWQMQRQGDLEDFQTKLSLSSQYGGATANQTLYTKALTDFNKLNQTLGAEAARKTIMEQYGIDPLGGVTLSSGDAAKKQESPFAELERGIAGSLSATGAERTGINLGPLNLSLNP